MRATRTLGSAVLLLVCGACRRGATATRGAAPREIETYKAALRAWRPVHFLTAIFVLIFIVMLLINA